MGARVVQKGQKHVTIVLGRSHNSSHTCNLTKKIFFIFFILVQFGAETTVAESLRGVVLGTLMLLKEEKIRSIGFIETSNSS